jgi:predicted site-specific integrase-resolvase
MTRYATMFLFLAFLAVPVMARAGEADDLQRQIDYLKQTTTDLERQDDQKSVASDIMMMRSWLDNGWTLRSQEKYDEVRIILDRCEAQANMVRQRLTAAKLSAQAAAKEDEVKRARNHLAHTKKTLENAKIQKARLEGKV